LNRYGFAGACCCRHLAPKLAAYLPIGSCPLALSAGIQDLPYDERYRWPRNTNTDRGIDPNTRKKPQPTS